MTIMMGTARRATPYTTALALLATLPVRFRTDPSGSAPGLVSSHSDLSGSGNHATSSGGLRPNNTGAELTFSGAQRLVTASYSMGARASGAVAFRIDSGANVGVFQFGGTNAHHSVLAELSSAKARFISSDNAVPVGYSAPIDLVIAWSADASGGTALINGTSSSIPSSSVASLTDALTMGDLTGSVYPMTGAIYEIIDIDDKISGTDLTTISDGLRYRWGI